MHDQPSGLSPAEEMDRDDAAVLQLLLHPELTTPLSEHELVLEIGDPITVADSLARLRGAGLIHRCGEFVFSTAAARQFARLVYRLRSDPEPTSAEPAEGACGYFV